MSVFDHLQDFVDGVAHGQFKPNQKWLRDMMVGTLRGQNLQMADMARQLNEKRQDGKTRRLSHTLKRLSRNLLSDRFHDGKFVTALRERAAAFTCANEGEGVVVGVDYTDIDKRYSRPTVKKGQEGASLVWNGSEKQTTIGYPVVQITASLPDNNMVPLAMRPYNPTREDFTSQNTEFLDEIARVVPYVGPRAIWTLDRGFDATRFFSRLSDFDIRWCVRLKVGGKRVRHLYTTEDGESEGARAIVDRMKTPYRMDVYTGKNRTRAKTKLHVGYRHVWIRTPNGARDPVTRTLISVWGFGPNPVVLLASEKLNGREQVLQFVRAYGRRWKVEEAIRAAKDRFGWGVNLESMRTLKMCGVKRMALITHAIYSFLAEVYARARLEKDAGRVRSRDRYGRRLLGAVGVTKQSDLAKASNLLYFLFRAVSALVCRLPDWMYRRWRGS